MKYIMNLHRVRKKRGAKTVLHQVDLELFSGETIGLFGENGAGKSTLLSICGGLIKPDGGYVSVGGRPVAPRHLPRLRRRVGYQTQTNTIADDLGIVDQLELIGRIRGLDGRSLRFEIRSVLDWFGLTGRGNQLGRELNGGARANFSLALAIVGLPNSSLVLSDEPTAALDYETALGLEEKIRALKESRDYGFLIVSHDLDWLHSVCDECYELVDGQLQSNALEEVEYV